MSAQTHAECLGKYSLSSYARDYIAYVRAASFMIQYFPRKCLHPCSFGVLSGSELGWSDILRFSYSCRTIYPCSERIEFLL